MSEETLFGRDFDAIERGQSYESASRRIDQDDVASFAALTGDQHPLHVDPESAASGPFGRPIVHGMLVLSCAVGVLPLDPSRVLALRRIRDAVFKRPLAVGDAITVHCRVNDLRPLDERSGLVDCEWRILGPDGKLRARARVELLWSRGEGAKPNLTAAGRATLEPALGDPGRPDELAPVQVTEDGLRVLI